uniref:uncharacterized protein LOC101292056 n=1 Tax=Fragaria vesca subsp. vesca TaxID=101020 RepID=UPI0005CA43AE|nr:PREDICTED: uncharacterized protein LOC101292056 [Fragaria vesca subsp. vesca]
MTDLTSALEVYDISCQLNVDEQLFPACKMTFSIPRTNSEATIAMARNALEYLQLLPSFDPRMVINYLKGSSAVDILTGYQENGLASIHEIKQNQFSERNTLLFHSLEELERLTGCYIWHDYESRVIIVGTTEGSSLAREVVEDCIVRNVPPAHKFNELMTSQASQKLETSRL